MLDFLTSKAAAIAAEVAALLSSILAVALAVTLHFANVRADDAQREAAGYKATLEQQALIQKGKEEAYSAAMKAIEPVVLHDKQVIQTIREAQPGPDACASAHQLITDTLTKERQP